MTKYEELATQYLRAYESKDIGAIESMISEDVLLSDWNVSGQGKEFFLSETKKNFASQKTIEIEILRFLQSETVVAAQLSIKVDSTIQLMVIDVISFDDSGKISQIQAYKGL